MKESDQTNLPPSSPKTPLGSALKPPSAALQTTAINCSSAEQVLEMYEGLTEKEQQKDLVYPLLSK
jgi:hypothetical protein